jgi:hypothetical protein
MSNPTLNSTQFTAPFDLPGPGQLSNPTTIDATQFVAPYDILPNPTMPSPATAGVLSGQFSTNINSGPTFTNPTLGSFQFKPDWNVESFQTFTNITDLNQEQFKNEFSTTEQPGPKAVLLKFRNGPIKKGAVFNNYTNIIPTFGSALRTGLGFAANAGVALTGLPQIGQAANQLIDPIGNPGESRYSTLPLQHLTSNILGTNIPSPVKYLDFRSRLPYATIGVTDSLNVVQDTLQALGNLRLDGASAATRGSGKAALYAAAAASPFGPYSVFNLDGVGKSGFGWGDHDNKYAIRADFTLRSEVATTWTPELTAAPVFPPKGEEGKVKFYPGQFQATRKLQEQVIPFRGDKVTVIDFGRRTLDNAYQWRPNKFKNSELNNKLKNRLDTTQDFIKFYFTGPTLDPSQISNPLLEDDVMVFRAILTGLDDSFSGNWSEVQMIGRADPNYQYTGYSRNLSVNFDVVATDRDELKSIYRKLNALAGYTTPTYNPNSIAMKAPWMRITIGDLFLQTPVVMTSLGYTYATDHSWEINIENDPEMFQVPHKVGVSCQFNIISNYLPQQNGRFFGLAKQFDKDGDPIQGNDNWLSDFKNNVPPPPGVDPEEDVIKLKGGEAAQNLTQEQLDALSDALRS